LEHLPHPGGILAVCRMPKPEVAHFVEAARQHVLEEPAHELLAAEPAGAPVAGLAVAILDADGGVIEAEERVLVMATRKT